MSLVETLIGLLCRNSDVEEGDTEKSKNIEKTKQKAKGDQDDVSDVNEMISAIVTNNPKMSLADFRNEFQNALDRKPSPAEITYFLEKQKSCNSTSSLHSSSKSTHSSKISSSSHGSKISSSPHGSKPSSSSHGSKPSSSSHGSKSSSLSSSTKHDAEEEDVDSDEWVEECAKMHSEYSMVKFRVDFKRALRRDPTFLECRNFQNLVLAPDNYLSIINHWFPSPKSFKLLFKAVMDGFDSQSFHRVCDNKGETVTIITTSDGYIFGGYAAIPWGSRGGEGEDNSETSFLFSLKNPYSRPPERFRLIGRYNAIYDKEDYGPSFGWASRDIFLGGDMSKQGSSLVGGGNFPSYANHTGIEPDRLLTGRAQFQPADVEVYQVK